MENTKTEEEYWNDIDVEYKDLSNDQLAEKAVTKAINQLLASTAFKAPRIKRTDKYWELYDGKTTKKLRQLFNIPIPVFSGMIDTLNAQYDTPVQLKFTEGDAADYFKVEKINGAFRMETLNSAQQSRWDSKLRMIRKHAIMAGRGIGRYDVTSDPEYSSSISVVSLKDFHFQPKGGGELEKHLFAGQENITMTKAELIKGAKAGIYNKTQIRKLIDTAAQQNYLPDNGGQDMETKLARFKPLGLNPDNNSFVGESVFNMCNWILRMNGERYYICFDPWTKTWIRFEKWKEMCTSDLYPWFTYATHEDEENFLSKAYGDDLYVAADAIVGMFNQEMTNREKRNNGSRAYDKDVFTDVRKLDDAMHRPDGLVPADTKGGSRQISTALYEFKTGELNGTVNLIDWLTGSLGRNTGANDLSMGEVQDVSKKASVTFAEQKSVSKRVSWASSSFQEMMASLGEMFIWGLKDHMPSKMAIKILGVSGWDWDEITRLDLDTSKDIDVVITSTDKEMMDNDMKSKKRADGLAALGADPTLVQLTNPQWRIEQILRNAEYDDVEIAVALDSKNFADKKAIAHAAQSIQQILQGIKPPLWFGAGISFIERITDFAADKRATLGSKYDQLLDYAMAHKQIVIQNIERRVQEESMAAPTQQPMQAGAKPTQSTAANPGVPAGISKAMSVGNSV